MTPFEIGTLVAVVALVVGVLYAIFRDPDNHGSPFLPPR